MNARFRGHAETRIDEKGRLKMPSVFRKTLDSSYGGALFVTALSANCLHIYPAKIWDEIEGRALAKGMNPHAKKFLLRANRYGAEAEMDGQGRVSLKPTQRAETGLVGEATLIGCADHLELWSAVKLSESEGKDALTDEDLTALDI